MQSKGCVRTVRKWRLQARSKTSLETNLPTWEEQIIPDARLWRLFYGGQADC